jgi:hypothetical protein
MEPVCVFPGCRRHAARGCEIDHRIPYDHHDPEGVRGGGRTCSCNLQPLCKNHHQQKTAGALRVRAITHAEDPTAPAGTLEWTLPSGVTCRTHPHIAHAAPIPTQRPGAHPAHDTDTGAQADTDADTHADSDPDGVPDSDWADRAWQRSRDRAAQARADRADRTADADRAAEQARRDAERIAWLADHPPF